MIFTNLDVIWGMSVEVVGLTVVALCGATLAAALTFTQNQGRRVCRDLIEFSKILAPGRHLEVGRMVPIRSLTLRLVIVNSMSGMGFGSWAAI